jgi:hypothetical protein
MNYGGTREVKMSENTTFLEYLIGGLMMFFGVIIPLSYIMAGRQPFEFLTDIKKIFKKGNKNEKRQKNK